MVVVVDWKARSFMVLVDVSQCLRESRMASPDAGFERLRL